MKGKQVSDLLAAGDAAHGAASSLLAGLAIALVLAIGAQWLAWRIRLPAILLLLLFGVVAGPIARSFGWASPLLDPTYLASDVLLPFVSVAVAIILFEGGLTLSLREVRNVGAVVRNLVTVGVLVTWVVATLAAYLIIGMEFRVAVLLGGILTVTGPTVVGPLLRHVRPHGATSAILKWEGIVIDPIGATLAVLVFEFIVAGDASQGLALAARNVVLTLLTGGVLGVLGGLLIARLVRYHWVPDFLHNPVALMCVVVGFAASDLIQPESGLFTVTLMGIVLANRRGVDVGHILEFKENLRVLLISMLFIVLAGRLSMDDLASIDLRAIGFVLVLIVVARPLGVLASTVGAPLSWGEKAFLAWMAPRGIVAAAIASVFSIQLGAAGIAGAEQLVPVTFCVIVVTVAVYGLTALPVALRLGIASPNPQGLLIVGAYEWARDLAKLLQDRSIDVVLADTNRARTNAARMAGLRAYNTNILSEVADDQVELGGVGRVLAVTSNDGVNALIAQHFAHEFGRQNVYQLSGRLNARDDLAEHLRGRSLFAPDLHFWELERRCSQGAGVKATGITETFTFQDFRAAYGPQLACLLILHRDGRVTVCAADVEPVAKSGDTIVHLSGDDR